MCQLLGVSSNNQVDINFSIQEFQLRGSSNYHGYGFAFYKDGLLHIIKKPISLAEVDIQRKEFSFKSKIIIGHVRLASCGSKAHHNTHPFGRDQWSFAHNGTVMKIKSYPLHSFKPEGDTDSEYAFCYLLEKIAKLKELSEIYHALKSEAHTICQLGSFNFLLSDGTYLFAFGHTSLYYVKRESPFQEVTLKDKNYHLHLKEIKQWDEKAILIATEPLTKEENWVEIAGLKVFKDGEEVHI
ncbi:MAG: class II glutamine amidotransferase [Spirochaetes bacterium]|nr:class II glutamine amidotransferase [Spirochaetota bacterium]